MATTIRLTRMGRKKRPFYRLVVLDSRKRRDGAYLANLGYYNPFIEPHELDLRTDEIIEWLGKGATVSETARSLLRAEGVLYKFSLLKQGLDAAAVEAKVSQWREAAADRKQNEAEAAAARRQAERDERDKREAEAKAAEKAEAEAAAAAAAAEAEAAEKAKADAEAAEAPAGETAEAAADENAGENAGEDGDK